ncbi:MAG: DUF1295 domain-containing protein [Parachlamydiaceae bacterium]|nr:DUF1295 domain-containing protein [Parachlamydiaceae bacterium]
MIHFFLMLGINFVVVEALMILFWVLYLVRKNVSVIDIGWGIGFILAALTDFILGDGYLWRQVLVLLIVSLWGLRLTMYLAGRFIPDRDDPRYRMVLENWGYIKSPIFQVLGLFLFQGLLITVLSIPFILMNQNVLPFFSAGEVFGLLIWAIGLVGETVADSQLSQFKDDSNHHGQVCSVGLWKYSRHPNYFFEWIVWIGYAVMAFSAPWGWLGMISPVLMIILLYRVSGIPYSEAQALSTRGEAYEEYQRNTSKFFPWFSYPSCK